MFSLSLLSVKAQEWTVYTTANSLLPSNHIQAIAIQKNGIKWVGTPGGLARFDGQAWVNYNTTNSKLPSSNITAIAAGKMNDIWIGTNSGLVYFNGTAWIVYTTQNSALSRNTISKLFWDGNSETLWVATEIGLAKFDGTTWVNLEVSNPYFADELILSIEVDKKGFLWIGTFDHFQFQGRLWQFNGSTWRRTKLEDHGLSSSFPTAMVADEQNILWLTIKGTMGGFLVSISNDRWDIVDKQSLPCLEGGISAIVLQGTQKWMGTGAGLLGYKDTACRSYTSRNSGLPDNLVSCIAIDEKGNKWMGTISGGLARYKDDMQQQNPVIANLHIFPNPVKETASFSLQLPFTTQVVIQLFSTSGQLVQTLLNQAVPAGNHTFTRQFSPLPKGLYYCRMRYSETAQLVKKFLVQ